MTLVEVLAALALLAGLMLAGVEWTVTATRIAAGSGEAARWNAAARAALERIGEDLAQGDFVAEDPTSPRVWVEHGRLTIETREGAPVRAVYAVHGSAMNRTAGGARLLLREVQALVCRIDPLDPDGEEPGVCVLTVEIRGEGERSAQRAYVLAPGWSA